MVTKTDQYIQKFNDTNWQWDLLHIAGYAAQLLHDHPQAVTVGQVGGGILGAGALAATPWVYSAYGLGAAAALGAPGALVLIAVLATWVFLNYFTCQAHPMSEHVFQEKEFGCGKLYYDGYVPILELGGDNSYEWGMAHGYLLGEHIYKLRSNFELIIHTLLRVPRAQDLPQLLETVKPYSEDFLLEMRGIAEGYNQWAQETGTTTSMTVDDVLLLHLIADSKHFHPKELAQVESLAAYACTGILAREEDGRVVFGRNMDWLPFGQAGASSFVIKWKEEGTRALTIPGMIGVVTGWNTHGVSLAMNVCPGKTEKVEGMPAVLYNRDLLRVVSDVHNVMAYISAERPLGPYHLIVAHKVDACCISFFQGENPRHHIRILENEPLFVVNWCYPECRGGSFASPERTELLERYFQGAKEEIGDRPETTKLVQNALGLSPLVNSAITMHSLVFNHRKGQIELSWDNGFAASSPRQILQLFD